MQCKFTVMQCQQNDVTGLNVKKAHGECGALQAWYILASQPARMLIPTWCVTEQCSSTETEKSEFR